MSATGLRATGVVIAQQRTISTDVTVPVVVSTLWTKSSSFATVGPTFGATCIRGAAVVESALLARPHGCD